ncbi:MAG TPA: hypothetical protein VMA95_13420 [Streptosporangiaceae bacterium]|nr:hypothetical protein [Streptosporangiaceae bacterium]
MHTGQLEQLARQRTAELQKTTNRSAYLATPAASTVRGSSTLRTSAGWALVSLGLRLAASGSR